MARSPAHRFGQIVGGLLEAAIEPLLSDFADELGLFLDKHGRRPARDGRKLVWVDRYGNAHELDYVLERGGTPSEIGAPVAFIESAWRRYTKHSRNKAQEIQAAVMPLLETYRDHAPFAGVVLGGVFTGGSRRQLESRGFKILHFPYELILAAFEQVGIDASFDEHTPDDEVEQKLAAWDALPTEAHSRVTEALIRSNAIAVKEFMDALASAVNRRITTITVLPLHGRQVNLTSVEEAVEFILGYASPDATPTFHRFETTVRFSNGDRIEGSFSDRVEAIRFLELVR